MKLHVSAFSDCFALCSAKCENNNFIININRSNSHLIKYIEIVGVVIVGEI